jgi:hypothetical protein
MIRPKEAKATDAGKASRPAKGERDGFPGFQQGWQGWLRRRLGFACTLQRRNPNRLTGDDRVAVLCGGKLGFLVI